MKNFISKLFNGKIVESTGDKLSNLKELRSIQHPNGVRVYSDLSADVLAAKAERLNSDVAHDPNRYRPRVLSVSKTIYPCVSL